MQRTLFVGIGGSGGETVRLVMRELDRRLRSSGWSNGLPAAWQFVHIDVREKPDDVGSNIPAELADRLVHLGLGKYPLDYGYYARSLLDDHGLAPAVVDWLPPVGSSQSPPHTGAGQRRAVGRAVMAVELSRVQQVFERVSNRAAAADGELKELAAHFNIEPMVGAGDGLAFVIGSLGGGSGSGAALDAIQVLRGLRGQHQWLSRPYGVLYAPDVFDGLPPGARKGIEGNSLAALSELMAAYLHTGPLHSGDARVLANAGCGQITECAGPEAAFIVGASGGATGIAFANPTAVYEATAKGLSTIVGSPRVASQFDAYARSNLGVAADELRVPLGFNDRPSPATSIGYASVSLGKELFASYAAERLASAALTRLREGYLEGADNSAYVRVEALIEGRAELQREDFLRQSGLWELGTEYNQVLDVLRSKEAQGVKLDKLAEGVLKGTVKRIEMSVDDWIGRINGAFQREVESFGPTVVSERIERAGEWVSTVQDQLLEATVEALSRNGLDVTARLLDMLTSQIEDAERSLDLERSKLIEREGSYLKNLDLHFKHLKARAKAKLRGDASSAPFKAVVKAQRDALSDRTEAEVRKLAQDLLVEVRLRLIPPLKAVLESMATSLASDLAVPEIKLLVEQWSSTGVGRHLLPTPNEVLLAPIDEFPAVFEEILSAQFEAPINDALGEALEEVIRGGWPSDENIEGGQQTLVNTVSQWQPDVSSVRVPGNGVRSASFTSTLSAKRIHDMADQWVRNRRGALRDGLRETLAEWLDADAALRRKRGEALRTALATALTRSSPLVELDLETYQRVHGGRPSGPRVLISAIPLNTDHPAYGDIAKLLEGVLPHGAIDDGSLFKITGADSVEVVALPDGPVHPIVMGSLMRPIQETWSARRANHVDATSFWQYRRARSLPSFIPLPPELQSALVQGWLIAQILGHLQLADGSAKTWTTQGSRAFPEVLVGPRALTGPLLPAILESYPLALLSFSAGVLTEFEAYNHLIWLGSESESIADKVPSIATSPCDLLSRWIGSGELTGDAPMPPAEFAGTATMSPGERAAVIRTMLEKAKVDADPGSATDHQGLPHEIRDDFTSAVESVISAVDRLTPTPSGPPRLQ